ncbi:hypothetical protein CAPI_05455 [Corynebacterium capitovis DSM 44611]|uniref:ACT domain-containing protein n=1 Tax=Corynebacterium capitovis TaxID=131081 RepID=UPI0003691213|nr:ACT domain-containing protein [Corynebacterium capitovis]WKD57642.1 hypothetical protein CAPI_05455 [Corynebacterium capitovis DSM 44611]
MHAIITTTGADRVGIIAGVAGAAAENGLNILDLSQTIMDDYFTMVMRVETTKDGADGPDVSTLQERFDEVGARLGVIVRIQSEALFTAMNEV